MSVKPPKTEMVTARVSSKTKRQLSKLPYSVAEVLEIGAEYVSSESNKLDFEKGELELEISRLKKVISEKEHKLTAINNRLRIIAPSKVDEETLQKLLVSAAKNYANDLIATYDDMDIETVLYRLEHVPLAKSSIRSVGEEWGFDSEKFLVEVKNHLEEECITLMYDKNSEDI